MLQPHAGVHRPAIGVERCGHLAVAVVRAILRCEKSAVGGGVHIPDGQSTADVQHPGAQPHAAGFVHPGQQLAHGLHTRLDRIARQMKVKAFQNHACFWVGQSGKACAQVASAHAKATGGQGVGPVAQQHARPLARASRLQAVIQVL
ncbi:hypothetical protein D3C71_1722970 [compost metagenome]